MLHDIEYNVAGLAEYKYTRRLNYYENAPETNTPISMEYYTYDSRGNLVIHKNDTNADGKDVKIIKYTYDKNSNITMRATDKANNGEAFRADDTRVYTFDEEGNLLSKILRLKGEKTHTTTHTYDEHNNRIASETDNNYDSFIDYTVKMTYDFVY